MDELRQQIVDAPIDERVQVTYARETGIKIDDADLNRAIGNIALQNQMTVDQLRAGCAREGIDYGRFRDNIRDQIAVERVRDRAVGGRIQITDPRSTTCSTNARAAGVSSQYNIAQILVTRARERDRGRGRGTTRARRDGAGAGQRRRALRAGRARMSEDGNRATGGEIGMRPADRLPDVFVEVVRPWTRARSRRRCCAPARAFT